jgi:hypothetical protein
MPIRRGVGACEGQGKQPELLFVFLRGIGCRPQETRGRKHRRQARNLVGVLCWLVSWYTQKTPPLPHRFWPNKKRSVEKGLTLTPQAVVSKKSDIGAASAQQWARASPRYHRGSHQKLTSWVRTWFHAFRTVITNRSIILDSKDMHTNTFRKTGRLRVWQFWGQRFHGCRGHGV